MASPATRRIRPHRRGRAGSPHGSAGASGTRGGFAEVAAGETMAPWFRGRRRPTPLRPPRPASTADRDPGPTARAQRRARMPTHKVVKHDEWLKARKTHLAKEKEFTHMRDQLSRERRELPWELVDKPYRFEGEPGTRAL